MKQNEITEKILLGLCDLISLTEVFFSRESLLRKLDRLGGVPSRRAFLNSFYSLQRSGLWYMAKSGQYKMTKKGQEKLDMINLRKNISKQKWDGLWRVIIFDISETKKSARDSLRYKLKQFGFYHLQKSVFVFPYDCKKEIDDLAELFEEINNIEYITAQNLGSKEQEAKAFFNL